MPNRDGMAGKTQHFNIFAVVQNGRLMYEAIILAASLAHTNPNLNATFYLAEPQPGPLWPEDPRIQNQEVRDLLISLGAKIIPFESKHFGSEYPYGNKIEALFALPKDEPFVFFDTDTLITGLLSRIPFDFSRPSASMRREGTWPEIPLYGPGYAGIWRALYDRYGLDFESSLDKGQPDEYWERYLYFNAGFFFGRCPHEFGELFLKYALDIRDNPPDELACQSLDPWLDQIALPLVIHALGGGRDTLPAGMIDGRMTCHWRVLSLLYARESDRAVKTIETVLSPNKIKKVVKKYEPIRRLVLQGKGHKARELFDRNNLPRKEAKIRNTLKRNKLWMR